MKKLIIVPVIIITALLIGCGKDDSIVDPPAVEEHVITGIIFMVGSSSSTGLALLIEHGMTSQEEYLMQFTNKAAEDTAYYNQGQTANVYYNKIIKSKYPDKHERVLTHVCDIIIVDKVEIIH